MNRKLLLTVAVLALLPGGQPGPRAAETHAVAIRVDRDHIDFLAGKDLVGRYHIGHEVAKPFFWPLNDPDGDPVTRAPRGGSADHPHQKSAWFCHGDVIPEGMEIKDRARGVQGVDFWAEGRGHGKIVCTRVEDKPAVRGDHGRVTTWNEWRTAEGRKVLDEVRVIHFYNFGKTRLFVLDIDLHASVVPITFGDTKEGSMGVRVNDAIREKGGKGQLVNADGKVGEKHVWGRHSAWCDYSGPIRGKAAGITLFDHPANRSPACWHSRSYGLMAANPFGRQKSGFPAERGKTELVRLARGQHLKLRYGMLIHPGDVKEGRVAAYYQQYLKIKE